MHIFWMLCGNELIIFWMLCDNELIIFLVAIAV